MSSPDTRQFMREMVAAHPFLQPIYAEHLEDNYGDLLPQLLMADICRWGLAHRVSDLALVWDLLWWLEGQFEVVGADGDSITNVIAVSFIEHLPAPGEPDSVLVLELGPRMRAQYDAIFGDGHL